MLDLIGMEEVSAKAFTEADNARNVDTLEAMESLVGFASNATLRSIGPELMATVSLVEVAGRTSLRVDASSIHCQFVVTCLLMVVNLLLIVCVCQFVANSLSMFC